MAPPKLPPWAKSAEAHDELRKICDLDPKNREMNYNMYWCEVMASKLDAAFDLMKSRSSGGEQYKALQIGGVGGACTEWLRSKKEIACVWAIHEDERLAYTGLTRLPDDGDYYPYTFYSGDVDAWRMLKDTAPNQLDFIIINATFISHLYGTEIFEHADKLLSKDGMLVVQYLHHEIIKHFGLPSDGDFSLDTGKIKGDQKKWENLNSWRSDDILPSLLGLDTVVESFDVCRLRHAAKYSEYFRSSCKFNWQAIFSLISARRK